MKENPPKIKINTAFKIGPVKKIKIEFLVYHFSRLLNKICVFVQSPQMTKNELLNLRL